MADKRIYELDTIASVEDIDVNTWIWMDKQAPEGEPAEPSWKVRGDVFKKILDNFATHFVPNVQTVVDKCYWHEGELYKCNVAYSGVWTPANFTATSIDELFARKDILYALTTYTQNVAASIAPEFDPTRTSDNSYKAGETVTYTDGKQYTFIKPHYGPWSSSDVRETNVDAIYSKNYQFLRTSEKRTLASKSFKSSVNDGIIYTTDTFKILYIPIKAGQAFEVTYNGDTSGRFNVGYSTEAPAGGAYPTILYENDAGEDGAMFRTIAPADGYMLVTVGAAKNAVIKTSTDIVNAEDISVDKLIAENEVDTSNATHKLINLSTGKWMVTTTTYGKLVEVPAHSDKVFILPSEVVDVGSNVAWLKDASGDAGDTPNYCTGYTGLLNIGAFTVLDVPSDAKYMFVQMGYLEEGLYTRMPRSIIFNKENYAEFVKIQDENILSKNVKNALVEVKADATGKTVNIESLEVDVASCSTVGATMTHSQYWLYQSPTDSIYFARPSDMNTIVLGAVGATEGKAIGRITFAKKLLPATTTNYSDLVSGGYLCGGISYTSVPKADDLELAIPDDCAYIYLRTTISDGRDCTPSSITLYNKYVPEVLEIEGKDVLALSKCHVMPSILAGKIGTDGEDVADAKRVRTTVVYGDMYCKTNDGFKIESVHLFDSEGELVGYNYFTANTPADVVDNSSKYDDNVDRSFFGTMNLCRNLGVVIVFVKSDGSDFETNDCPIDLFGWVDDKDLTWVGSDNAGYQAAVKRALMLQRVTFETLAFIPTKKEISIDTKEFLLANSRFTGIPYSSVKESEKYVGYNVSLRTFMTALKNKRSLIYTENVDGSYSNSGYGFTWHGVPTGMAYYGTVCSNYVSYVLGLPTQWPTNWFDRIPGMTELENVTAANIQPMTVILNEHHVFICLGVVNDRQGNRKLVVIAEAVVPTTRICPYTVERLQKRFDSETHQFFSYDNLADNAGWTTKWPGDRPFVEQAFDEYPQEYKYNERICTFAGDYASFATGDDIYINAKPGTEFTAMQIYLGTTLVQTIDISGMTADDDGYIDVDVSTYTVSSGKYKVRLSDGNGGYSDYCYFERVACTLSLDGRTVSFTASGGTPYLVRVEPGIQGGFTYQKVLTAEEVTAGSITLPSDAVAAGRYMKLCVQGDYGMPCIRQVMT